MKWQSCEGRIWLRIEKNKQINNTKNIDFKILTNFFPENENKRKGEQKKEKPLMAQDFYKEPGQVRDTFATEDNHGRQFWQHIL